MTYRYGVKGHYVSFFRFLKKMLFLFLITWYDYQTWLQEPVKQALYMVLTDCGQRSHRVTKVNVLYCV